jgi:hypothetical protein
LLNYFKLFLKIAIKNQFGGNETQEKYNWFVEATAQWMCEIGNFYEI